MGRMASIAAGLLALLAFTGCGGDQAAEPSRPREASTATLPSAPLRISLTSSAFTAGRALPSRFTCRGEGAAPPLRWSRPPRASRELVLVVDDPDAPSGSFVHWVVLGLSPTARGLPAGTKPATLRLGRASSGKVGYEPPCPPKGDDPHRYVFALYALRRPLGLPYGAPAQRVLAALRSTRPLARGTLVGRFSRPAGG